MKKHRFLFGILVLGFACLGAWFSASRAIEQVIGDNVVVERGNDVEEDLIAAGRTVQAKADVIGDAAIAGSEVTVSGAVQGYLMAAGRKVVVKGPVGNDLWAAGSTIELNATVADNATLAGGDVHLQSEAEVRHNALIAASNVNVQGRIERDLKLAAGEARLSSEVGGSVEARVEKLALMPGAVIRGNLIVYSPWPPEISPQAQVLGRIEHHKIERRSGAMAWLGLWGFSFLALLILGSIAVSLSSVWTSRVVEMITGKPGASLLTGFLGLFLVPLAALLLLVTVIGIPVAVIVMAFYVVALLLSGVFVSYLVGGWLLTRMNRPQASPWARIALGALVVSFFASLPWVGWAVRLLVLMMGFGALVLEQRDLALRLRAEGLA